MQGSTTPGWESQILETEWRVYRRVIVEARAAEVPFAFGGAYATAVYTGAFRNTKDFDFYILPRDRERMIQAITRAGLEDYYERLPYDRSWIYRASEGEIIVDAIWAMANHRAEVDPGWLSRGPEVTLRGEHLRPIPLEELIWSKLYVFQRGRCDWVDVFKLIDAQTDRVNWEHLLDRMADDTPLLTGAMAVYGWLAPDRAGRIANSQWQRLGLEPPAAVKGAELSRYRAALLDSRPWFRV